MFESSVIRDGKRKTFSLQHDLTVLGSAITQIGSVALVTIDAITSYMGMIDSHRTTDLRAILEPIADFAIEFDVTHPPKAHQATAIHAFTGSLAFVAAARLIRDERTGDGPASTAQRPYIADQAAVLAALSAFFAVERAAC